MFPIKIPIHAEREPKTGLIPCVACTQCCQYIAIEIDTPETRKEFDNIRWYLYHPGVEVYIDHEDTWNVLVHTRCENLAPDGRCGVYETRPIICRDFSPHACEPNTGDPAEKVLLKTAADLDAWLRLTLTDVRLARAEEKRERARQRRAAARAGARDEAKTRPRDEANTRPRDEAKTRARDETKTRPRAEARARARAEERARARAEERADGRAKSRGPASNGRRRLVTA